jgi:hypothetical protein
MRIQRVILAADDNPRYRPFLPLAVEAWTRIVGLRPTVAIVGDDTGIDSASADVVRFAPIPGVPTGRHAQLCRLLLPTLFPDDVSLISDADLIPLSRHYFLASVRRVRDDRFVVFRNGFYDPGTPFYPMCYCAARGRTFGQVFDVRGRQDFEAAIRRWAGLNWGWSTDERVLFEAANAWHARTGRLERLYHRVRWRIDRENWAYSPLRVRSGLYIDAHLPHPYEDRATEFASLIDAASLRVWTLKAANERLATAAADRLRRIPTARRMLRLSALPSIVRPR